MTASPLVQLRSNLPAGRSSASFMAVVILAGLLALGLFANGVFMLADPVKWYFAVPGVTTTGQFNQHFIRDIGIIFLFLGAAFGGGVLVPAMRFGLWAAGTAWLDAHAFFHLWEVAAGICGPAAIARDFPAVSLPALLAIALTAWSWKTRPRLAYSGGA